MIIICLTHQLAETVTVKQRTPIFIFYKCPAYNTIREVLFENIFNLHINESFTFDLLMFGNPYLNKMTNEAIFEYVHEYIRLSKRFN